MLLGTVPDDDIKLGATSADKIMLGANTVWSYNPDTELMFRYQEFTIQEALVARNGVSWAGGGSHLYVFLNYARGVIQFTASTPYDVTTLTFIDSKLVDQTYADTVSDLNVTEDGKYIFIVDRGTPYYFTRFEMDTPYDVTTINNGTEKTIELSSSVVSLPDTVTVSPDGTRAYISGGGYHSYTMSTPYDPSTATYDSKSTSATYHYPKIDMSGKYILSNYISHQHYEMVVHELTVPWDVTGGITQLAGALTVGTLNLDGFGWHPDSRRIYLLEENKYITDVRW